MLSTQIPITRTPFFRTDAGFVRQRWSKWFVCVDRFKLSHCADYQWPGSKRAALYAGARHSPHRHFGKLRTFTHIVRNLFKRMKLKSMLRSSIKMCCHTYSRLFTHCTISMKLTASSIEVNYNAALSWDDVSLFLALPWQILSQPT